MSLEHAAATAERLRDLLAREVEAARDASRLLRRLDVPNLLARAATRGAFLAEADRTGTFLAGQLEAAAPSLRPGAVTLDALRGLGSRDASRLADLLAEIRGLSATLAELDRLNAALASRALASVRAYVQALAPAPAAYDRSGGRASAAASPRATVRSAG
jgi:hypothetical protein